MSERHPPARTPRETTRYRLRRWEQDRDWWSALIASPHTRPAWLPHYRASHARCQKMISDITTELSAKP